MCCLLASPSSGRQGTGEEVLSPPGRAQLDGRTDAAADKEEVTGSSCEDHREIVF